MSGSFRFLDDVAVADAAFEAEGGSPSELFTAAARAVIETMVDPASVGRNWQRDVEREDERLDDLLFDWLSEIVYRKDADGVVFSEVTATVAREDSRDAWRLRGTLFGESIDPARHRLRADVKAVTKHLYRVVQDGDRWTSRVVLDI